VFADLLSVLMPRKLAETVDELLAESEEEGEASEHGELLEPTADPAAAVAPAPTVPASSTESVATQGMVPKGRGSARTRKRNMQRKKRKLRLAAAASAGEDQATSQQLIGRNNDTGSRTSVDGSRKRVPIVFDVVRPAKAQRVDPSFSSLRSLRPLHSYIVANA
jgi:hypothetical protein